MTVQELLDGWKARELTGLEEVEKRHAFDKEHQEHTLLELLSEMEVSWALGHEVLTTNNDAWQLIARQVEVYYATPALVGGAEDGLDVGGLDADGFGESGKEIVDAFLRFTEQKPKNSSNGSNGNGYNFKGNGAEKKQPEQGESSGEVEMNEDPNKSGEGKEEVVDSDNTEATDPEPEPTEEQDAPVVSDDGGSAEPPEEPPTTPPVAEEPGEPEDDEGEEEVVGSGNTEATDPEPEPTEEQVPESLSKAVEEAAEEASAILDTFEDETEADAEEEDSPFGDPTDETEADAEEEDSPFGDPTDETEADAEEEEEPVVVAATATRPNETPSGPNRESSGEALTTNDKIKRWFGNNSLAVGLVAASIVGLVVCGWLFTSFVSGLRGSPSSETAGGTQQQAPPQQRTTSRIGGVIDDAKEIVESIPSYVRVQTQHEPGNGRTFHRVGVNFGNTIHEERQTLVNQMGIPSQFEVAVPQEAGEVSDHGDTVPRTVTPTVHEAPMEQHDWNEIPEE